MWKKLRNWTSDRVFKRVLTNSTYLIISNLISVFITIYITSLLGVYKYGVLGIITAYVTNVNKLFSFRMNEMIVRFVSVPYEAGDFRLAAALIKFGGLIEAVTSLIAFVILAATARWGTEIFLHDQSLTGYVLFYGLTILTGFAMETANGVLRVINRYGSIAIVSLLQNLLIALIVLYAATTGGGLETILAAYFIGKAILGLVPVLLNLIWLPKLVGAGWWKAPISLIRNKKEILRFTVSTNISNTINLVARDGEILWVGAFLSPQYAGYYKTAMTVINMVLMPINPFIDTTYIEMMRAIARRNWDLLQRLLKKITTVSLVWTASAFLGLILLGKQLLFTEWRLFGRAFHVFSAEYLPAYPIILILMAGYGIANVLFWNRTLLLSFSKADTATRISFWGMVLKVLGALLLLSRMPYYTEAILMSLYLAGTVLLMTFIGISHFRSVKKAENLAGNLIK